MKDTIWKPRLSSLAILSSASEETCCSPLTIFYPVVLFSSGAGLFKRYPQTTPVTSKLIFFQINIPEQFNLSPLPPVLLILFANYCMVAPLFSALVSNFIEYPSFVICNVSYIFCFLICWFVSITTHQRWSSECIP